MKPQVLDMRPAPLGAGGKTVAFFDAQVTPDCRLFNLRLVDGERGWRVHSPMAFGVNTATFSHTFIRELTEVALQYFGANPRDRNPASAN